LLVGAALLSTALRLLGTPVEMHDVPPPEMEETPSVASTAAETAET
jgi:hypothetical protein